MDLIFKPKLDYTSTSFIFIIHENVSGCKKFLVYRVFIKFDAKRFRYLNVSKLSVTVRTTGDFDKL